MKAQMIRGGDQSGKMLFGLMRQKAYTCSMILGQKSMERILPAAATTSYSTVGGGANDRGPVLTRIECRIKLSKPAGVAAEDNGGINVTVEPSVQLPKKAEDIQGLLKELRQLPGFDKNQIGKALQYLVENSRRPDIFWGMSVEERSTWITGLFPGENFRSLKDLFSFL